MGLLLQNIKSHIFRNGCEKISHNIMRNYPLFTMCIAKMVDHHKIQWLVTNVVSHPKD